MLQYLKKLRGQQSIAIEDTNNDQQNINFQLMGWEEWMDSRKDANGLDVTESTSDSGEKAIMDATHKGDTETIKKLVKHQHCSSSIQTKPCRGHDKRVTIHMLSQEKDQSQCHNGKLILLPKSIEELVILAGKL